MVEDRLPPGTTFVSASNGGTEASPGVVRWNLGALAAGAGGSLTVNATTAAGPNNGTVLTNVASITDSTGTRSAAQATTIERSHTELEVTISAEQDPIRAGAEQTLTLTWANTGNQDTTNAVVTATVPSNTSFASTTGGGTFDGTDLVTLPVGALPAGATGSATLVLNVDSPLNDGTVLKSVASIDADNGQPDSAAAPFMVSSSPVIVASKSASAATVDAGGRVTFTISLRNVGTTEATGVTVSDTLPNGLDILSANNGGAVDTNTDSVVWNLGTLQPGAAAVVLTADARLRVANSTLTNTALIASGELPTIPVSASVEAGQAQVIPTLPWAALLALVILLGAIAAYEMLPRQRRR